MKISILTERQCLQLRCPRCAHMWLATGKMYGERACERCGEFGEPTKEQLPRTATISLTPESESELADLKERVSALSFGATMEIKTMEKSR